MQRWFEPGWPFCSFKTQPSVTWKPATDWAFTSKRSASGGDVGAKVFPWKIGPDTVGHLAFPPVDRANVIAQACERPQESGQPLGRFSVADLAAIIQIRGVIPLISPSTVRRWLRELAIKPWQVRSWVFPRDPAFEAKAGIVLDLYQGYWNGEPLGRNDIVLCADEKTCIQALRRRRVVGPTCHHGTLVDSDYVRTGTVAYLTALNVFQGTVMGKVVPKTGIVPFDAFADEVMTTEPYRSAHRVFWVVDNGSSHDQRTFPTRLSGRYPNAIAVHLPVHASWLNQVEAYYSILQRKALTPNDFDSPEALIERILGFQERFNQKAEPFKWRFTKADLARYLQRVG